MLRLRLAAAMLGILAGLSIATFHYARGTSYLRNDPAVCMNCHVMREHFDAWNRSSHARSASCNDCHTPHDQLGKYAVKALNGWNHGAAFTTGGFQEPIMIRSFNREIVIANCVRCHVDLAGATRQEMRSYVCAQCHVEYYFLGEDKILTFPWSRGRTVEAIEEHYDEYGFADWTHAETGAPMIKIQHPEFELWGTGIHARSGVSCADCHMPYVREGSVKVSDHWVRSPLHNISRACQACHPLEAQELEERVLLIQDRTAALLRRSEAALEDAIAAIVAARAAGAAEGRARRSPRPAPRVAVALGFYLLGEQHRFPQFAGGGAHPGRVDRPGAPGPDQRHESPERQGVTGYRCTRARRL